MTAAVSFPKLAALADAKFSYRDELGRQCREALSTIDRLRLELDGLERFASEHRCTPAERALIDAALRWLELNAKLYADYDEDDDESRLNAWDDFNLHADAVLAERGEA